VVLQMREKRAQVGLPGAMLSHSSFRMGGRRRTCTSSLPVVPSREGERRIVCESGGGGSKKC